MKLNTTHYILGIAGMAIAAIVAYGVMQKSKAGPADALAQCLTEKGVMMYGAYWCPHCQSQKKAFGNSWQYVKYIECSLPGGRGQTQECTDAGIKSYPTWVFPAQTKMGDNGTYDANVLSGELSFETLAQEAGCPFEGDSGEPAISSGEGMDVEGNTITPPTTTESVPVSE